MTSRTIKVSGTLLVYASILLGSLCVTAVTATGDDSVTQTTIDEGVMELMMKRFEAHLDSVHIYPSEGPACGMRKSRCDRNAGYFCHPQDFLGCQPCSGYCGRAHAVRPSESCLENCPRLLYKEKLMEAFPAMMRDMLRNYSTAGRAEAQASSDVHQSEMETGCSWVLWLLLGLVVAILVVIVALAVYAVSGIKHRRLKSDHKLADREMTCMTCDSYHRAEHRIADRYRIQGPDSESPSGARVGRSTRASPVSAAGRQRDESLQAESRQPLLSHNATEHSISNTARSVDHRSQNSISERQSGVRSVHTQNPSHEQVILMAQRLPQNGISRPGGLSHSRTGSMGNGHNVNEESAYHSNSTNISLQSDREPNTHPVQASHAQSARV